MVRSNKAQDKPYTGLTEIRSGEVAEDLAGYLADSEQTNSALALGVSINRDASVRAAGGYLVQVVSHACFLLEAIMQRGALSQFWKASVLVAGRDLLVSGLLSCTPEIVYPSNIAPSLCVELADTLRPAYCCVKRGQCSHYPSRLH